MGSDAALIVERPSWDDPDLVDVALARALAELPAAAAVVIDDAQFAEASQRTLASVAQRLPGHVRLLVASQHNLVFSTSRLRLAGVIAELLAGDLAFTEVEVEQLLELAGLGRELIDGRRLRALTKGWPAGVQMAVLAMRAGGDPREVIDALASTTQEASDYLANEVLNRLPPGLAVVSTKICVLDEFDAQLCEAVGGQDDARGLLDRVVADDLFIYQVGQAGERFRLHQMFAAFLRARLKSLGREQFRTRTCGRRPRCRSAGTGWGRCVMRWRRPICSWPRLSWPTPCSPSWTSPTRKRPRRSPGRGWPSSATPPRKPTPGNCSSSCSCWQHPGSGTRRTGSPR